MHTLLLSAGIALLIATHLTSGWAIPFAAFSIWVLLLLLGAIIDGVTKRLRQALAPDQPEKPLQPPLDSSNPPPKHLLRIAEQRPQADLTRMQTIFESTHVPDAPPRWRKYLNSIAMGEDHNERPSTSTWKWFLRAGDVLVLRFIPAGKGEGSRKDEACSVEFRGPDPTNARSLQLTAAQEGHVPIRQTGVHQLSFYDGCFHIGMLNVWLEVDHPDKLALSTEVQQVGDYLLRRSPDGDLQACVGDELDDTLLAAIPAQAFYAADDSFAPIFDSRRTPWDEEQVDVRETQDEGEVERRFRYYLHLSQADVLAVQVSVDRKTAAQEYRHGSYVSFVELSVDISRFVRTPQLYRAMNEDRSELLTIPYPGFYVLEAKLRGPLRLKDKALSDCLHIRLLSAHVQKPEQLRSFDLKLGWIEGWWQQTLPIPGGVIPHDKAKLE